MVRYDKSTAQRGEQYIEDRRRAGGSRGKMAGGVVGGGGLIGIIIAIIVALTGGGGGSGFDIGAAGFDTGAGPVSQQIDDPAAPVVDPQAETREYMAALMADIQDTWSEYFERAGIDYTETKLVLFTDAVQTGCGNASAGVGPFYCPAPGDNKVYIDLTFYDELATRFQAPGDFAQAYVIAHEIGHHIQSITGISDKVRQAQQEDPNNANEYSVRLELQADCLAGVWGFSANQRTTADGKPILEAGDIDEGLRAAQAVGDDSIQSQAGMSINPDTWTHGSAESRAKWFREGFTTGDPEKCDTFAASEV